MSLRNISKNKNIETKFTYQAIIYCAKLKIFALDCTSLKSI